MKLLLDTHAFIWWDSDPSRLSANALSPLSDPGNELILSLVSVWELQIKLGLGKVHLRLPLRQIVSEQQRTNRLDLLPITLEHLFGLGTLPPVHGDPFDRLLIAQAKHENIRIISSDAVFAKYPVQAEW